MGNWVQWILHSLRQLHKYSQNQTNTQYFLETYIATGSHSSLHRGNIAQVLHNSVAVGMSMLSQSLRHFECFWFAVIHSGTSALTLDCPNFHL
jgi:hypothetical protein